MTTDPTLTLLRAADPLDPAADLDPQGADALRVRTTAVTGSDPYLQRGRKKGSDPVTGLRRGGVVVVAACALAAIAIAVGLPGDGGAPTKPADARAALITAAERTASFPSGHLVWRMRYDDPALDLTNDVRYDGDAFENTWTTRHRDGDRATYTGATRVVGGRRYARDGGRPFVDRGPAAAGEGRDATAAHLKAADALADAVRAASGVTAEPAGDGTRYTADIPSAAALGPFHPPFERTATTVTITAVTAPDGRLRSLALRAAGEKVDIAFEEFGRPQRIVAP